MGLQLVLTWGILPLSQRQRLLSDREQATENRTMETSTVNNADTTLATLAQARQIAESERNTILGKIAEIDQQRQVLADRLAALNSALGSNGRTSSGRTRSSGGALNETSQKILDKMTPGAKYTYKELEEFSELTYQNAHGSRYHAIKRLVDGGFIQNPARSTYIRPVAPTSTDNG